MIYAILFMNYVSIVFTKHLTCDYHQRKKLNRLNQQSSQHDRNSSGDMGDQN